MVHYHKKNVQALKLTIFWRRADLADKVKDCGYSQPPPREIDLNRETHAMPQIEEPKTDRCSGELTEQDIKDTFEQLGLTNPEYLEYLKSFSYPLEPQEPPRYWYGADSGTSLIDSE